MRDVDGIHAAVQGNEQATGAAFAESHLFKWGYNGRSELTAADRHPSTDPDTPGDAYAVHGQYGFAYDTIGNRETFQLDGGTATGYDVNAVNQYTATSNPAETFAHDADGNLTQDGTFAYTWDAENRLVSTTKPFRGLARRQGTARPSAFSSEYGRARYRSRDPWPKCARGARRRRESQGLSVPRE